MKKEKQTPTIENIDEFKATTLNQAISETPQLKDETPEEVDKLINTLLSEYDSFEHASKSPIIHKDTDVVVVFSGPGAFSRNLPPYTDKDDRYKHLPWSRKMDRARVRIGVHLVRSITAKRLDKKTEDVTHEDIAYHGPYFHYAGTVWENNQIKNAIDQNVLKIPRKKLFTYDTITDPSGNIRPISNTADQITGFTLPENPRRIALIDHSAHLVRVLHIMGMFSDRIPEGTIIQPFPIPINPEGRTEYARMEIKGTLAYIYKFNVASTQPIAYSLKD